MTTKERLDEMEGELNVLLTRYLSTNRLVGFEDGWYVVRRASNNEVMGRCSTLRGALRLALSAAGWKS